MIKKVKYFMRKGIGKKKLLYSGIGSLIVKILSTIIAFLVVVAMARILGAEEYGNYVFVYTIITLIAVPAQAGFPQLLIRETARFELSKKWSLLNGLWKWCGITASILSMALGLITFIIVYIFKDYINASYQAIIYIGIVLIPFISLGNLRGAVLQGLRMVAIGQLPEFVFRPLLLLIGICVYWLLVGEVDAYEAMSIHVVAGILAFIGGAILLIKFMPIEIKSNGSYVDDVVKKKWIKAAIPLGLLSGVQLINNQADIVMLTMLATPKEVAIYKVVSAICGLVIFGFMAVQLFMAPHISSIYSSGNKEKLQHVVTLGSRLNLALALPVVVILLLFGDSLLVNIFGEVYHDGYAALIILALGRLVNASFGLSLILLNMTGHERTTLRIVAISAIANIVLNVFLIPLFGINGAAISTVIVLCIWNINLCIKVHKELSINSFAFNLNIKGSK